MFCFMFYSIFAIFVVCSFCGKDFRASGWHSWRCKEKLKKDENEQTNRTKGSQNQWVNSTKEGDCASSISNSSHVKWCGGKTCNGLRGLKLHHRSCRVIQGLGDITLDDVRVDSVDENRFNTSVPSNITYIKPVIMSGIKLPKTDSQ